MKEPPTRGAADSAAWLDVHGLDASRTPHWHVEIGIPSDSADTRFDLNIYPEEWGFVFRRGTRVSSIRVTDVAFVHGLDDDHLLQETRSLADIHHMLEDLEARHDVDLQRARATVKSNLVRAASIVRAWLISRR